MPLLLAMLHPTNHVHYNDYMLNLEESEIVYQHAKVVGV